jgi:hypothetical protein
LELARSSAQTLRLQTEDDALHRRGQSPFENSGLRMKQDASTNCRMNGLWERKVSMLLVEVDLGDGLPRCGVYHDGKVHPVANAASTYALACRAIVDQMSLTALVNVLAKTDPVDFDALAHKGRVRLAIMHPDSSHCLVSGTGLTHLGSADARDRMHRAEAAGETLTDTMKMFRDGLKGGRPRPGSIGAEPEWFFKGDGRCLVSPRADIVSPGFARDGGDEAELVGAYIIAPSGEPVRIGWAIGNEFSDHLTERRNYLMLAHSKLRPASFGPCLLVGETPDDIVGLSRVLRNRETLWQAPFRTGSANMCHSISNLEHHHFRYEQHRRPGDLHIHFFGAAALSFEAGVTLQDGDVMELSAEGFGPPLRNKLRVEDPDLRPISVRSL